VLCIQSNTQQYNTMFTPPLTPTFITKISFDAILAFAVCYMFRLTLAIFRQLNLCKDLIKEYTPTTFLHKLKQIKTNILFVFICFNFNNNQLM
jgi:hypothetical protein